MDRALSTEQLTQFREQLKQRYQDLWSDIGGELKRSDAESYQKIAPEAADLQDHSLATLLVDINLADIHRDIREMRDIVAALERITDGSYGRCSDCSTPIDVERLRVNPTAERCTACQSRYEETHMTARGATL